MSNQDMEYMVKVADEYAWPVGPWAVEPGRDCTLPDVLSRLAAQAVCDDVFVADSSGRLTAALQAFGWRQDWVWRETYRILTNEYTSLPTSVGDKIKDLPGHFLHVAKEDAKLISYTPTPQHGEQDRQVRTTLGKYLHRYQDELGLSDSALNEVSRLWGVLQQPLSFAITNDEAEIVHIYRHGPSSCMSSGKVDNDPMRVYAGPDTSVAALYRGRDILNADEILARAVVVPVDKAWVRTYADSSEMRKELEDQLGDAGYESNSDALEGKRLKLIVEGGQVVCPYIDGVKYGHRDGEFLCLWGDELVVQHTDGFAEPHGEECSYCGRLVDTDDITYVDGEPYCQNCRNEECSYAYVSRGDMEWVQDYDVYGYNRDGEAYTEEGADWHDMRFPEDEDRWGEKHLCAEGDLIETYDGLWYQDIDNLRADGYEEDIEGDWVKGDDIAYAWTEGDVQFIRIDDMRSYNFYAIEDRGETKYVPKNQLEDYGWRLDEDGEPEQIEDEGEDADEDLPTPALTSLQIAEQGQTQTQTV